MPANSYQGTLVIAQVDGTALSNTTTETSIIPAQAKFTLPPGFLDRADKTLRVRAAGRISNAASATLLLKLKFGANIAAASQAFALNATAKTNVTWMLEWSFTTRAVGASANLMHIGMFTSEAVIGVGTNTYAGSQAIPASSPVVGANFDSTASQVVDFTATWGAASASNSIQIHQYALESIN
jgi:hypothetical protein